MVANTGPRNTAAGIILLLLGVGLLVLRPTPSCPVGGTSSACNEASVIVLGAVAVIIAGVVVALVGLVQFYYYRNPPTIGPDTADAGVTPMVEPGLAHLYERPPPPRS